MLLSDGLDDLSKELGETTTNTTARRVGHYGDAVTEFANARKWPFLLKKNITLVTIASTKTYAIPAAILADMRQPGGIKAIYVGSGTDPFLPIDYDQRADASLQGGAWFYFDLETTTINFVKDLGAAGQVVEIHYYYVPARTTDTTSGTYPIPDRYRKTVATLAAAYVQWSRYLESQGNRLYNVYQRMLGDVTDQQSERPSKKPGRLQHPLAFRGFRRTYP